jgi:magnesium transporter
MVQRFAFHGRRPPAGSRPGDFALPPEPSPRQIHVIEYGPGGHLVERDVVDVEELAHVRSAPGVKWIEVNGFGDEAGLRRIGELFGIHPLALADVVNVPQRPKVESYEGHDLVIAWMARLEGESECELVQVGFIVGSDFVISFEEEQEDVFDPVRARIRGGALICSMSADYLAYALIDTLIDGYYPVLEALGEVLEGVEDETVERPTRRTMAQIHAARRLIIRLARTMRQHRDALSSLARGDNGRIGAEVRVYFRDAYDHAVQISEVLESYREIAVSLMEMYLSSLSNRMNEVMKVLTIISTIFIPLTFVVGVYGMNFEYMPELRARWGYPIVWIAMLGVAGAMVVYFRRKGWIGEGAQEDVERAADERDGGPPA